MDPRCKYCSAVDDRDIKWRWGSSSGKSVRCMRHRKQISLTIHTANGTKVWGLCLHAEKYHRCLSCGDKWREGCVASSICHRYWKELRQTRTVGFWQLDWNSSRCLRQKNHCRAQNNTVKRNLAWHDRAIAGCRVLQSIRGTNRCSQLNNRRVINFYTQKWNLNGKTIRNTLTGTRPKRDPKRLGGLPIGE